MSGDGLRRGSRRRRYAEVPEDLLFNPAISSHAKVAWGVLDRHIDNRAGADTEGCAFPGRERIAGYLGASTDTVDRALGELRATGWLQWERRGQGRTNLYVLFDEPCDSALVTTPESAPVRTQDSAPVTTPKRNGPKDNDQKGTTPPPPVQQLDLAVADDLAPSSSEQKKTDAAKTERVRPTQSARANGENSRTADPASELARRLVSTCTPCLSNNVRELTADIKGLMKDYTAEQIEIAARHPETFSWSFKALAYRLKQSRPVSAPTRRTGGDPEMGAVSIEERRKVAEAIRAAREVRVS